jgi:hypothetical protein
MHRRVMTGNDERRNASTRLAPPYHRTALADLLQQTVQVMFENVAR